ncbi:MAG: EVE domain-containing protein [Legionellales bacterium]|jgi:predicted RNA-binding protein with PUA-like domain
MMAYWLMKSEPTTYSIDDLAKTKKQGFWDGIRNYQVRNLLRDVFQPGDLAFFYHSSCKVPGIVGIMEITSRGKPDETAFDPQSHYFDPKSDPKNPRWFGVNVKLVEKFADIITLAELRDNIALENMPLLQRGNRLSITPVTEKEWQAIIEIL